MNQSSFEFSDGGFKRHLQALLCMQEISRDLIDPPLFVVKFVDSVEMYREVMRSVEEHKDRLRTDDLQQLHAMYNLDEILQTKPEGVQPTLRDGQLKEQVKIMYYRQLCLLFYRNIIPICILQIIYMKW